MRSGWCWLLFIAVSTIMAAFLGGCSGTGTGIIISLPAPSIFNVTASGQVRYRDLQYDPGGFTGIVAYKPVRYAGVEVVDSVTGIALASGSVSPTGAYAVTFDAPYDKVYVRVLASTPLGGGVEVYNNPYPGEGRLLYSVATGDMLISDDALVNGDLDITGSLPAEAFNILDVLTAAHEFVLSLPGGSVPPLLRAFWQEDSTKGTFYCNSYCSSGEGIYVLGKATDGGGAVTDTDGYDDDVLWHEYGHFIANALSVDDSPGGPHALTDSDLDLRLSWSEGWGGYVQGSVKRWITGSSSAFSVLSAALTMSPEEYVDTGPTFGPPLLYVDYSNPGGYPYVYSGNEVAVAKVLLDLEQSFGLPGVWNIFRTLDSYLLPGEQTTLEAFWDGWVDTLITSALTNSILIDREIYFMEDPFEPDGLPDAQRMIAVNVPAETHYLYSNSSLWDTDYIAFNAAAAGDYVIETSCLSNGADTQLALLDISKNPVSGQENDDTYNPGTCPGDEFSRYASKTNYSITTPGIYYAMINTSTAIKNHDPSSLSYFGPYPGRYGTYRISVTGP